MTFAMSQGFFGQKLVFAEVTFATDTATFVITSGSFSETFTIPATPFMGLSVVYLEWNDLAGVFSFGLIQAGMTPAGAVPLSALDGVPSGVYVNPLVGFTLDTETTIIVGGVSASFSSTLFTTSFNFIHNSSILFTPIVSSVVNVIYTEHGPLVKDWGDYTPAGIDDVAVRVNGLSYTVVGVNPYLGQIFIDPPIAKVTAGSITVEVDYKYMPDATFPMVLNVPGLALNTWSRPVGSTHPSVTVSGGGPFTPLDHDYRVVLQGGNPQPKTMGYKFLAVEKGYSAVLNDPESLVLNAGPGGSFFPPVKTPAPSYDLRAESRSDWEFTGSVTEDLVITGALSYVFENVSVPFESESAFSARFSPVAGTYDGVWSGSGVGFHDEKGMVLLGLLKINNVEHLGIANGNNLSLQESWLPMGTRSGVLTTSTSFTTDTNGLPSLFAVGSRFQVLTGVQAGTYTITSREDIIGTSYIGFSPPAPGDPSLWGNNPVNFTPEFAWDGERVFVLAQVQGVNISIVASSDLTISDSVTVRRSPFPMFSEWSEGRVFMGNLSPVATLTQDVDLVVFQSHPAADPFITRRSAVDADFNDLQSQGWFFRGQDALNEGVSAECVRFDPAFSDGSITTTEITFQETFFGFSSYKICEIRDRKRKVEVHAIVYDEAATRELVSTPHAFLSPISPWSGTLAPEVRPDLLHFEDAVGTYSSVIAGGNRTTNTRIFRFKIRGTSNSGFTVFMDSGSTLKDVAVTFGIGEVSLTSNGANIATYSAAWDDNEFHTVQVDIGSSVEVFVDGTSLGTELLSGFSASTTTNKVGIRTTGNHDIDLQWLVAYESLSGSFIRTFAFKTTDTGDFNTDYVLPTPSPSSLPNSNVSKLVEVVDYSLAPASVRIHFDPSYGVVLQIPSSLPGSYTPDFATQSTNPTRGYCNIEYRRLPFVPGAGSITFASGSAIMDIDSMQYQIIQRPMQDYQITRYMVLNRMNIIHSGEYLLDSSPEVVLVERRDALTLSLRDINYNAKIVYQVVDDSVVRFDFDFDPTTQIVTMHAPLASTQATVYFVPSRPITATYLRNEPAATTLYERTPPYVWSQTKRLANILLYGVGYDGVSTALTSDDGSSPLTTLSATPDESLYSDATIFVDEDRGSTGIMTIAQDSLIQFELVIP
jgi:hypothetical protein